MYPITQVTLTNAVMSMPKRTFSVSNLSRTRASKTPALITVGLILPINARVFKE
jgi:hypothetical protein